MALRGLHHVTAFSGGAQRTQDFCTRVLGQRLVKRTVNFDDPGTYHLYYGDEIGRPGSVMTFFPWEHVPRGTIGAGQVSITHYAVPAGSLNFWEARMVAASAPIVARETVLGEERLVIRDPDGLLLALVGVEGDARAPWAAGEIPEGVAIRGFRGVTLALHDGAGAEGVLTGLFGYAARGEEPVGAGTLRRFAGAGPAEVVDLHVDAGLPRGREGAGTVHHVAFRVPDRAAQDAVRAAVAKAGHQVTPPIDRDYFHAIYFRIPGGVLFEVATDEPGFTVDEPAESLGAALKLPARYEPMRERIEAVLPALEIA